MAGALTAMGALHFIKPEPFDELIPPELPGTARAWTYGSGVAELAVAGLLAIPATRRLGGLAAAGLYLAVWPGNMQMVRTSKDGSTARKIVAWARLPLQIPMIRQALRIHRHA